MQPTATKVTFRGGPKDGEKRVIEGRPDHYTFLGWAMHLRRNRSGMLDTELMETFPITYARTDDWLADGSVVYQYEMEASNDHHRTDPPGVR